MKKPDFVCRRCGNCCRWKGFVNLAPGESERIGAWLQLEFDDFMEKYVVLRPDRRGISLTERTDGSCIFLEGNRCLIQEVKPGQCRAFPERWNFPGYEKSCMGISEEKEK